MAVVGIKIGMFKKRCKSPGHGVETRGPISRAGEVWTKKTSLTRLTCNMDDKSEHWLTIIRDGGEISS